MLSLLLASLILLASLHSVFGVPAVAGVLTVTSVPADPGVPSRAGVICTLYSETLHYRTIGIRLSDIESNPQYIGLSDIRLTNNYRIPSSDFPYVSYIPSNPPFP
jgi:hypothetical protein